MVLDTKHPLRWCPSLTIPWIFSWHFPFKGILEWLSVHFDSIMVTCATRVGTKNKVMFNCAQILVTAIGPFNFWRKVDVLSYMALSIVVHCLMFIIAYAYMHCCRHTATSISIGISVSFSFIYWRAAQNQLYQLKHVPVPHIRVFFSIILISFEFRHPT